VKGVKNILSSKGKMSDDMEDQDAKRQEELRKQREYQRAYDAKNREEINRKRREQYAKMKEDNPELFEEKMNRQREYKRAKNRAIKEALKGIKIVVKCNE
jgi:hypothetical protein